jgi:ribosomal protein S18 acetylase RimI-like enzyme
VSADPRLVVRPVRWDGRTPHPDDLAVVKRLYAEYERSRLGTVDTSDADTAAYFLMRDVDRVETVLVERDGVPLGVVYVQVQPPAKDMYADIACLPGEHEQAVLEYAVEHAVAAGRRLAATRTEPGWTLRTGHWSTDELLPPLLAAHGLERVRRFYRMRIESTAPEIPSTAPDLPPGVEIVVRDDDETRRAIWAVDNEAFLDHWNFTPTVYEEWWDDFSVGDTRDPEGWWLLTVDGEPAAFCLLDESRAELGDGYVGVLGVRRRFRGRGLATLLLQRAFVRYRDMGRAGTQLGVDADSLTGAVGVYERVGMRAVHVIDGWALALP